MKSRGACFAGARGAEWRKTMEKTKIAWTENTFNPWVGCDAVSPGCANCYAKRMTERWHGKGAFAERRRTSKQNWKMPAKWNREAFENGRRVKVFCGSMCDWLDDQVPAEWLSDLLFEIARTPYIDWLMLTKRPENFGVRMMDVYRKRETHGTAWHWLNGEYPENVWFGVTAENQKMWDKRVEAMREIPARVKWVSAEPMVEKITPGLKDFETVKWVVAGGENGPKARRCDSRWILGMSETCMTAFVPFFFKQWGENADRRGVTDAEGLNALMTGSCRMWPE